MSQFRSKKRAVAARNIADAIDMEFCDAMYLVDLLLHAAEEEKLGRALTIKPTSLNEDQTDMEMS